LFAAICAAIALSSCTAVQQKIRGMQPKPDPKKTVRELAKKIGTPKGWKRAATTEENTNGEVAFTAFVIEAITPTRDLSELCDGSSIGDLQVKIDKDRCQPDGLAAIVPRNGEFSCTVEVRELAVQPQYLVTVRCSSGIFFEL
jgi:hypothetical protein